MKSHTVRLRAAFAGMAVIVIAMAMATAAQQSNTLPNPYRRVDGWAQFPADEELGEVICVETDPSDNLWVFHRGTTPILKFDPSGKIVRRFGAGMFVEPHGMALDSEGNVWVSDNGRGDASKSAKGHQIFKFSPDGKLLMTIGTGAVGQGQNTFIAPTDVVVSPQGNVFVADGHGDAKINYKSYSRVVKFSKDGKFVKEWGGDGTAPGQFAGTHGIAMDSQGRIFVVDRGNSRLQIFDQEGRFIDQWKQFGRPSGVTIDKNDIIYVADSQSTKRGITIGSAKDGKVTAFLPNELDPEVGFHTASGDSKGNLFAGAVIAKSLAKFVRR